MDKCYSCLQLIYLFIVTGNLHTFSVCTPFWLLIVPTHLGSTWPNGINWLTLTISTRCYCKKEIKSTSALKSDNHRPGFKYSRQFLSMQSSERESHVCASTRSWAVGDKISLDFKLEFIPFVKIKRLRRLHIGRKSVGCHCCKLSSYAFWGTCTFAEMRDHARKLLWIKENSHKLSSQWDDSIGHIEHKCIFHGSGSSLFEFSMKKDSLHERNGSNFTIYQPRK